MSKSGGGDYDSNYACMIGTSRTAMLQAIGGHVHKAEAEEHVTTWGGGGGGEIKINAHLGLWISSLTT